MARTYRNVEHLYGNNIYLTEDIVYEYDGHEYIHQTWKHCKVEKYGWQYVKDNVPTSEYKHARKLRGDCVKKFYRNRTLAKFVRQQSTKVVRASWKIEKHKYFHNPEHEVIVDENYRFDFHYW